MFSKEEFLKRKTKIKVSVILVVAPHKRPFYSFLDAINSILSQTHYNLELIIVNRFAEHGLDLVNFKSLQYARVSFLNMPDSASYETCLRAGLSLSRGEFISFTDTETIFDKNRLHKQIAHLEFLPKVGAVATNVMPIDEEGYYKGIDCFDISGTEDDEVKAAILLNESVLLQSILMRKQWAAEAIEKFGSDQEFLVRLISKNIRIEKIPLELTQRVILESSQYVRKRKSINEKLNIVKFIIENSIKYLFDTKKN